MTSANDPWGRVDADGTVYVRTADGERVIGSWQAGSPEEALAFYQRAGFRPFRRQIVVGGDPRLDGTVPRGVAGHVPLIE